MNKMREAGLPGKYSVELLLLSLDKLRKITMADGQVITTEMTKKQQDIFGGVKNMRQIFSGRQIRTDKRSFTIQTLFLKILS